MQREEMSFDVVIVGAGPAGLSASIKLSSLAKEKKIDLAICVLEKGEEVGAHILSGAVLEPRALNELIPNWQTLNPPIHTPVSKDRFIYLTKRHAFRLPTPMQMKNHGNYIISLGQFCRFLSNHAESLGVNIFPGFAATDVLYEDGKVAGVITGDKGIDKNGERKATFQAGYLLRAKQVILAEGCRGSLTAKIMKQFDLQSLSDPQTYGLGIKELWEIPDNLHEAGSVIHTIGWPLDQRTYGGSFVYHFGKNLLSLGLVVGLDYANPYFNPYETFQLFKTHPAIKRLLINGKRIAYGARTLIEGGYQSLPNLTFPGGLIVGDAAGFLNVPKIKGIHMAMKSGMVAADSLFPLLQEKAKLTADNYRNNLEKSWMWKEFYRARNIRPSFKWGLWPALIYSAFDTYILRGCAPWTLHHHRPDNASLKPANQCQPIEYPKHDNKITFDITTSVFLTNIHHEENQPNHLLLKNTSIPIDINFKKYAGPESRYCPANVYEFIKDENNAWRLQINNGNCIQCKACDIKDPEQNIVWTPPEGGSGPQYGMM